MVAQSASGGSAAAVKKKKRKWPIIWWSAGLMVLMVGSAAYAAFISSLDPTKLTTFFAGLQGVGGILTAAAVVAGFAQVREARKQIDDNRDWNRMSFALTFLPQIDLFYEWEKHLEGSFIRLISRRVPLSEGEVTKLVGEDSKDIHLIVKSYLNTLEAYCVAINRGLADEQTAKDIFGFKLVRHFEEMKPYIDFQRTQSNERSLFCELEKVCQSWSAVYPSHPSKRYGIDDDNH